MSYSSQLTEIVYWAAEEPLLCLSVGNRTPSVHDRIRTCKACGAFVESRYTYTLALKFDTGLASRLVPLHLFRFS